MNVQFAIKDGVVYVLEVNPRASRTVPFVAKVIGKPIAAIAAEVMAGKRLADFGLKAPTLKHVAVKEAVFPFARFPGVDPILGPEMRSTGEVMGIDSDFAMAFVKSQLGSGQVLPMHGTVFISVKDSDKDRVVAPVRELEGMGFKIIATRGTKRHLEANGITVRSYQQGSGGAPAHRRRHEERRRGPRFQHYRRRQGIGRQQGYPPDCLASPYTVLYNCSRCGGGHQGHHGP